MSAAISTALLVASALQAQPQCLAPRAPSRTAVPTCAAEGRPNFALKLGTSVAAALMVLGSPRRALAGARHTRLWLNAAQTRTTT